MSCCFKKQHLIEMEKAYLPVIFMWPLKLKSESPLKRKLLNWHLDYLVSTRELFLSCFWFLFNWRKFTCLLLGTCPNIYSQTWCPRSIWEELLPSIFSLIATWSSVCVYLIYNIWNAQMKLGLGWFILKSSTKVLVNWQYLLLGLYITLTLKLDTCHLNCIQFEHSIRPDLNQQWIGPDRPSFQFVKKESMQS